MRRVVSRRQLIVVIAVSETCVSKKLQADHTSLAGWEIHGMFLIVVNCGELSLVLSTNAVDHCSIVWHVHGGMMAM